MEIQKLRQGVFQASEDLQLRSRIIASRGTSVTLSLIHVPEVAEMPSWRILPRESSCTCIISRQSGHSWC